MKFKAFINFLSAIVFLFSFTAIANDNYIKFNYGITNNNLSVTADAGQLLADGSIASMDDEDQGYMLSAGSMIGGFWGIDIMYYDMGSTSFKVDASERFKIDSVVYEAQSAGTISNDITGYGTGIVLGGRSEDGGFLSLGYSAKWGLHAWDKGGSTNLLYNNTSFAERFYNEGVGSYGGLSFDLGLYDAISLDLAYDIIGIANDASFSNNSTLISGGLKINF